MLTISPTQRQLMGEQAQTRFAAELVGRVAELWPSDWHMMGAEAGQKAVLQGITLADEGGFRSELDVARFVHLSFALRSLQFGQQPWAAEIMADPDLPPRIRMNRLFNAGMTRLVELEAAQAAQTGSRGA